MIGVDTNILVRILTADDPEQTELARRYLEENCSASRPGLVNSVVLTELVWVLGSLYGYARSNIVLALESLLSNGKLAIESREQVQAAVLTYKRVNCDFIDALIGEINLARGCEATATFDRRAAKLKGFVRVS
jgi:predicted nucleic-acid-binding protein